MKTEIEFMFKGYAKNITIASIQLIIADKINFLILVILFIPKETINKIVEITIMTSEITLRTQCKDININS